MSLITVPELEKMQSLLTEAGLDYQLEVEIKSQSDRIKTLHNKLQKFLQLGAKVGILIDPDELTVTVYKSPGTPIILRTEDTLTIPELFPGWELPIAELWPPIFTDEEIQALEDQNY